jgi:intracellular sulfur oxidation DsrE/DsrF family protein
MVLCGSFVAPAPDHSSVDMPHGMFISLAHRILSGSMPHRFSSRNRRTFAALAVIVPMLASQTVASAQSENKTSNEIHRLAIHVDDNDPAKMNLALNNAQNISVYYSGKGEEVTVEIVTYGPGLHMLRADTSPKKVQDRLQSFSESMPNVSFAACENTRAKMAKAEGKKPSDIPLVKNARRRGQI